MTDPWVAVTSVRYSALSALLTLVGQHPSAAGVETWPGWPGDKHVTSQMLWCDDISGTVDAPLSQAGRLPRDDRFSLGLSIVIVGAASMDAAMVRLFEVVGAVEHVLADDHTLGGAAGVVSAQMTDARQSAAVTPDGAVAFAELTVDVFSRLG